MLYGGAIAQAYVVKGKKHLAATSDWMEIEKQRGIGYLFGHAVQVRGLLHQHSGPPWGIRDFSEDTYRTLMAATQPSWSLTRPRVWAQTIKLFKVCVMRDIPIFTFINKCDREARDP